MSEQSVNGPEYLERRGWQRARTFASHWRDPLDEPCRSRRDAILEQHARDAAALDRVLALCGDRERIGRIMHESWTATKGAQGFHGPKVLAGCPTRGGPDNVRCGTAVIGRGPLWRCPKFHPDMIPWDALPAAKKAINRTAADGILAEITRLVGAHGASASAGEEEKS